MPETTSRLSFDLPQDINTRLNKFLPWGMKSLVIRALIEQFLEDLELRGNVVITELMDRRKK